MFRRLILLGALCTPLVTWTFFKPVRVIAPEFAGVSCIDETLCTDDVNRYQEARKLYDEAFDFVELTAGSFGNRPRIIFCAAGACAQSFGLGRRSAVTIGTFGIVVSDRAWKDHYVRHEMIHHLQNERLGMLHVLTGPEWFIEGMAYSLSEDPRPKLSEPFERHRSQFADWYAGIGKERLWTEALGLLRK